MLHILFFIKMAATVNERKVFPISFHRGEIGLQKAVSTRHVGEESLGDHFAIYQETNLPL